MTNTKQRKLSLIALFLVIVMLFGSLIGVIPASAYEAADKPAEGTTEHTGTPLPEGAEPYDKVPSTALAGEGTKDAPYLIENAADFVFFRSSEAANATADTYFKLTGDIYLNDGTYGTSGTGTNFGSGPSFEGVLDGDGHTIFNFYTYVGTHEFGDYGLFNVLNGTVKNLTVDGVRAKTGYDDMERHRFGTIATYVKGTVENVTVKNLYFKFNGAQGGIAGEALAGAQFINCTTYGLIEPHKSGTAGGIISKYSDSTKTDFVTLKNCVNNTTINSPGATAGGMIGYVGGTAGVKGVEMFNCVNNAAITAITYAGGMVGQMYRCNNFNNFNYCVNNGNIKTSDTQWGRSGGFIGLVRDGSGSVQVDVFFRNCTNNGTIVGYTKAGGFVGQINSDIKKGTEFYDCVNNGSVDALAATSSAGGFLGTARNRLIVVNSANYGTVGAGGLSYNAGAVAGDYLTGGTRLEGFLNVGDVTATTNVGVLFGKLEINNTTITLTNVWANGTYTANDAANGLAGVFAGITNQATNTATFAITGCGFDVALKVGETDATLVSFHQSNKTETNVYNDGTEGAANTACPVVASENFASGALAALNAIASTTYNKWIADETKVAVFEVLTIVLTNLTDLIHGYDCTAHEIMYSINNSNAVSAVVTYYDMATGEPVALESAPMLPGTYRVVVQGKDSAGEDIGAPAIGDFVIDKGTVGFELTEADSYYKGMGIVYESNWNPDPWYKWSAPFKGSAYEVKINIFHNTDGVKGEYFAENKGYDKLIFNTKENSNTSWGGATDITETGSAITVGYYWYVYSFAETELYKAASKNICLKITKGVISYPEDDVEGRWTVPTLYNGKAQTPVFNSVGGDADAFDIVLSGDVDVINATDGLTLTTTATLTLKAEYAEQCDLAEGSPASKEYTVTWGIGKLSTSLAMYDADNNKVEDPMGITFPFDGIKRVYTIKLIGPNGEILKEDWNTWEVSSVGTHEKTFTMNASAVDDPNLNAPEPLSVCAVITARELVINVSGLNASYVYTGSALDMNGVVCEMPEDLGLAWGGYVFAWEQLTGFDVWTAIEGTPINVGTYRLTVTNAATDEECVAKNDPTLTVVEITKATPAFDFNTSDEAFTNIFTYDTDSDTWYTVYDGNLKPVGYVIVGTAPNLDTSKVSITYVKSDAPDQLIGDRSEPGIYTVSISFEGDSNYNAVTHDETLTIEIRKAEIRLPVNDADFWTHEAGVKLPYSGEEQVVDIIEAIKEQLNVTIIDNKKTGGGKYTAKAYLYTKNANTVMVRDDENSTPLVLTPHPTIPDCMAYACTLEWEIVRASVDMSGIVYPSESVIYTGNKIAHEVTGLPSVLGVDYTITLNGESVDTIKNVGVYTVTYKYTLLDNDFSDLTAEQETVVKTITVNKADVDLTQLGIVFNDAEQVYSGRNSLEVTNVPAFLTCGLSTDGVTVDGGRIVTGVKLDDEGNITFYTITAIFEIDETHPDAANYNALTNENNKLTAKLTITPLPYDPTDYAVGPELVVVETGEAINWQEIIMESLTDGISIANPEEIPTDIIPGEYSYTLKLSVGKDYQAIDDIELTLVILAKRVSSNESDVNMNTPNGAGDDVDVSVEKVTVTNELNSKLNETTFEFGEAVFKNIWTVVTTAADGTELQGWTIEFKVNPADMANGKYAVVVINYAEDGSVSDVEELIAGAEADYVYDAEAGVILVAVDNMVDANATYALATAKPVVNTGNSGNAGSGNNATGGTAPEESGNGAMIAIIIVVVVVVLAGAGVGVFFIIRKKKGGKK